MRKYTDVVSIWTDSTSDGVKLEIRRKAGGSGKVTCYIYVVSDALVEIMNGGLVSIKY